MRKVLKVLLLALIFLLLIKIVVAQTWEHLNFDFPINAEEKSGPVYATKDDVRITPIGKFLRKTRIDEIHQLINVLRGEMSVDFRITTITLFEERRNSETI